MIQGKTVLAIIAGRGGSKGLPRKNVLKLKGKPLIAWSIDCANQSRYIDRLVLSSDDEEINRIGQDYGCQVPFTRPAHLATDDARIHDAIGYTLENLDQSYDIVVLLQATSPLRNANDIDGCLETLMRHDANSCVSVSQSPKSPYWAFTLGQENELKRLIETSAKSPRRQELPETFTLNGAVYTAETAWFMEHRTFIDSSTRAYVMPKERSVDVDDKIDFLLCEAILNSAASA